MFLTEVTKVWAKRNPIGLAPHRALIMDSSVEYPISHQAISNAKRGLGGNNLTHQPALRSWNLVPCQPAGNTPLLLVKKPHSCDYQPVQDLRKVNKQREDSHPTVPNSYTLLRNLPPGHTTYTVLNLKDAFFSLPLAPKASPYSALNGKNWKQTSTDNRLGHTCPRDSRTHPPLSMRHCMRTRGPTPE